MKALFTALIALALMGTVASADVAKGQKLYTKKLKSACGITGAAMAGKYTQDEWGKIQEEGNINKEIKIICPEVKQKALKDKYTPHYFDFFYEYSSDSGNVPSC